MPDSDELRVRAVFAGLDPNGNIICRNAEPDRNAVEELCERLEGMEIDGIHFSIEISHKKNGDSGPVLVLSDMKNSRLSGEIVPNDPMKTGVPLPQIAAKKPDSGAKFTASVLNRLVYRSRRLFGPGHNKNQKNKTANVILISAVER